MNNIKILDCTLRDGGYINEWRFGSKAIEEIIFNLSKSNIDIIECGFLTSKTYDPDCSLYNSVEILNNFIKKNHNSPMYVAMIALGEMEIDPNLLSDSKSGPLDGIRLTFRQHQIDRAFDCAKIIMQKGYKLFMQPVGTTNYSDKELIELVDRINNLKPFAFYLVDTLGVMFEKDLIRQTQLIDYNLDKDIRLGFHSHNNLQLSFSNAQALTEYKTEREIIFDSSANGMGRGAGNLCSELFMEFLNKYYGYNYDVLPMLEIIDKYLNPIYLTSPWGYNSAYFISAINHCHPNYSTYLITKHTLSMSAISNILGQLPQDKKRFFDKALIEKIYQSYQNNAVDDIEVTNFLRKKFDGKNILVIAPGASIKNKTESILKYITKHNPIVISVNFVPDFVNHDILFVGNNLRFNGLKDEIDISKTIFTSNIMGTPNHAKIVNYPDLVNASADASDSSGIMILKLLKKTSVKSVALAGYDGFSKNPLGNYINNDFCTISDFVSLREKNFAIKEQINLISEKMKIKFITNSIYKKD